MGPAPTEGPLVRNKDKEFKFLTRNSAAFGCGNNGNDGDILNFPGSEPLKANCLRGSVFFGHFPADTISQHILDEFELPPPPLILAGDFDIYTIISGLCIPNPTDENDLACLQTHTPAIEAPRVINVCEAVGLN